LVVSVEVWLPEAAPALLLCDWSPVEVVLSMFTDERPRRSMFGLTFDVEPVMLLLLFAVDPVSDEVVGVEPAVDALEGELEVMPEPLAAFEDEVSDLDVSLQSWCTGLAECSFAWPVDLSASLPACGCACPELPASRLLHGGRLESRLAVELAAFATAGAAIMAATASELMN
jgi:hypothetical protein